MCACRLATGVRKAVDGWGLKLLCKDPRWNSDTLTVIETPQVALGPLYDTPAAPGHSPAAHSAATLQALFSLRLAAGQWCRLS
jgi:hypothetical protein